MKQLINKYFEGNTSLEEEQVLREYFRHDQIAEELKPFAPLFQFIENEQVARVSDRFDERLFAKLKPEARLVNIVSWRKNLLRIAAVGAVVLASYFALRPAPERDWEKYWASVEITDEQQALEETKKALSLLSSKLNKGKQKTIKEVSKTEKVTKYLN